MLFAQTGMTSSLPRKPAEPEVNPYMIALWWIVPLALAAVWIALIVRSNQTKYRIKRASNQEDSLKSKEQRKVAISIETPDAIRDPAAPPDLRTPQLSSKKSKKEKSKGKQKEKGPVSAQETAPISDTSRKASESREAVVQAETPTTTAIASSAIEPKPSTAIFESLRDATRGRRKAFVQENFDNRESRDDSSSRENDAYNQLFGGKFERIIPKQSLRSVANRWPAAEATASKSNAPSVARMQPSPPAIAPAATTQTLPENPAPAEGLKSFVSKVKNSPETPSQSDGSGTE